MKILLKILLFFSCIFGELLLPIVSLWYRIQDKLLKANGEFSKKHNITMDVNGVRIKAIENSLYSERALNNYTAQSIGLLRMKDYSEVTLRIPFKNQDNASKCQDILMDKLKNDKELAELKDNGTYFQ